MKKVVVYGSFLEYNMGLPSLLLGFEALMDELYPCGVDITYYESKELGGEISANYKSKIKYIPFKNNKDMLKAAVKYKILKKCSIEEKEFFSDLENADCVVDIYGIYFCSKLEKQSMTRIEALYSAVSNFIIPFISKKFFGVKTVKTACSYGPFGPKGISYKASIVVNNFFDAVCAREKESRQAVLDSCKIKKDIILTPDLANLMKYEQNGYANDKRIAIVVSHQLEKQWSAEQGYKECVVSLINYITEELREYEVYIIPNETSPLKKYNDIDVAKIIANSVNKKEQVKVLDDTKFDAENVKNIIASCDIVVSARYHSCVASLSSAIPTLAMGWHYKYKELLELYNQSECIVSGENCSSKELIKKFDYVWQNREKKHNELREAFAKVENELIESYGKIFIQGENK